MGFSIKEFFNRSRPPGADGSLSVTKGSAPDIYSRRAKAPSVFTPEKQLAANQARYFQTTIGGIIGEDNRKTFEGVVLDGNMPDGIHKRWKGPMAVSILKEGGGIVHVVKAFTPDGYGFIIDVTGNKVLEVTEYIPGGRPRELNPEDSVFCGAGSYDGVVKLGTAIVNHIARQNGSASPLHPA